MKRYSARHWKSAQNSAATKANTAITATENKIESTDVTTSLLLPRVRMQRNPTWVFDADQWCSAKRALGH
jgi:hypothetical protein